MNRFTKTLNKINDRIKLPQPQKSRILLEISADLNDAYDYYIEKGIDEDEARKKAEEKFNLTDKSIKELKEMNQTIFRRFADRSSEYRFKIWEWLLLVIILGIIFYLSAHVMFSEKLFPDGSTYNWPILAIFVIGVLLFIYKIFSLYIKKDHNPVENRKGVIWLLVLGALSIYTSFLGYFIDLYVLSDTPFVFLNNIMLMTIVTNDMVTAQTLVHTAIWFSDTMGMVMFGMFTGILCGIFWFVLEHKIIKIEIAESAYLLSE